MSVVILFAILFQSFDSFEHLSTELTKKKCVHKHNSDKDITHQHKQFEKCFVCKFTFSSQFSSDLKSYLLLNNIELFKKDSFSLKESVHYFIGISYSLRGPPTV